MSRPFCYINRILPHIFQTRDISGKFILLGTGTSVGVPAIGCACSVCTSKNPRNKRTRCAAIIGLPQGNLLIDTPPDLRTQLLREGIGIVHAVIFTHEHADHIFGLDDLRLFPFRLNGPVPLYCEPIVRDRILKSYDYAFRTGPQTHEGAAPKLELLPLSEQPVEILGAKIRPLRLIHGPNYQVLGFRIGNIAYCTDTSEVPSSSYDTLAGCEILILDALRYQPHPTHLSIGEALQIIERVRPKRAYLTHVGHDVDYDECMANLPSGVELAYDGLSLSIDLASA